MKTIFILTITLSFYTSSAIYSQDDDVDQDVDFYNKNLIISGSLYALTALEAIFFPVGEPPKPLYISYKNSYRNPLYVKGSVKNFYGMYSKKKLKDMEAEECYIGKFNVSEERIYRTGADYYDLKESYDYVKRKKLKRRIMLTTAGIATLYLGGSIKIVDVDYGTGDGIKQNVSLAKIIRMSAYIFGGLLTLGGFLPFTETEIEKGWDKYESKYNSKYSISVNPVIMKSSFGKTKSKKDFDSYGINFNLIF